MTGETGTESGAGQGRLTEVLGAEMTTAMPTHLVEPIESGSERTDTLDARGAIVATGKETESGTVAIVAATTDVMMKSGPPGESSTTVAEVVERGTTMPLA